eukprot:746318-Hanusia_phi.AAC.1
MMAGRVTTLRRTTQGSRRLRVVNGAEWRGGVTCGEGIAISRQTRPSWSERDEIGKEEAATAEDERGAAMDQADN